MNAQELINETEYDEEDRVDLNLTKCLRKQKLKLGEKCIRTFVNSEGNLTGDFK